MSRVMMMMMMFLGRRFGALNAPMRAALLQTRASAFESGAQDRHSKDRHSKNTGRRALGIWT